MAQAARGFRTQCSRRDVLLDDTEPDSLACFALQREHRRLDWSSNLLKWLIRAIKRRADVVVTFSNGATVMPVVGSALTERHVGLRHLSADSLATRREEVPSDIPPALLAAG